ncbi:hypothetical protein [Microbispora triticiradicis]|uniref:hypothetical protein n=1 Tax=Microbispora triticiradicis TaxID=2200763 RepID=UPI001AD6D941|nr:hypothetical protein [Microbispora triticiradicis]MBO4269103.1 hypothetical protein [Microbispora triticiradicis]
MSVRLRLLVASLSLTAFAVIAAGALLTTRESAMRPSGRDVNIVLTEALPSPGHEARTEADVRRAAKAVLDARAAGDHGRFWDAWVFQAQSLVKREEYVRSAGLCEPARPDWRPQISRVTLRGDIADLQVTGAGATALYQFRYEEGRWRYIPGLQELSTYVSSGEAAAKQERLPGACRG